MYVRKHEGCDRSGPAGTSTSSMSLIQLTDVTVVLWKVGKTTTSLALISGLVKRFGKDRVGYIKPVGQQHENVNGHKIDKDARLMKEYFGLGCDYQDMSPVVMPSGYTRDFLDGKITEEQQLERIRHSYSSVSAKADVILMEGSGHTGVGGIVNLNNARVAKELGADMVLVANGGLGSAFDELDLNRVMCEANGVRLRGVIINKVRPDKLDMIRTYFTKLVSRWNVPLLGVIPDEPFLGQPTLHDYEKLFKSTLLAGHRHREMHYDTQNVMLVATGLNRFLHRAEGLPCNRPLFVTHCSRSDIIMGFATHTHKMALEGRPFEGAMILSGRDSDEPTQYIKDMIKTEDLPAMHVLLTTAGVMQRMQHFVSKLNIDDKQRVGKAISHYESHIDFDQLLRER